MRTGKRSEDKGKLGSTGGNAARVPGRTRITGPSAFRKPVPGRRTGACSIGVLAWMLVCGQTAMPQYEWGWIEGTVVDAGSSHGMDGVRVSLSWLDGLELGSLATDSAGSYRFLALPPGDYELRFERPGYSTYRVRSVRVHSGHTSTANLRMERRHARGEAEVAASWRGQPANPWAAGPGTVFSRERLGALPSPRNIWALLENQEPSSVTNHVDEGGIDTGVVALVGRHGSTWTQNSYRFDGLNVTDPYDTGKPLVYPDLASLEEFRVGTAFLPAATRAPGASYELTSRAGMPKLQAQIEAYYLGQPFQSGSFDPRLREFGFTEVRRFRNFEEGQFTAGGPLWRSSKWSFFTSLGVQHLSKVLPGFSAAPTATVSSGLLRFDGNTRPRDQLTLTLGGQIVKNSHLGARPGVSPQSTLRGNDRFEIVQGHWTHRKDPHSVFDLGFGFSHCSATDTFQKGVWTPTRAQMFTGEVNGAAPLETDSALSRFSLVAQGQTWHRLLSSGRRNRLDYGIDLEESLATEDRRVFQGVQLLFYPTDVPSEIVEYDSPSHAMQRLRELSLFFDDRLSLAERIWLRLGLNLDISGAALPRQRSDAGFFAPAREFAAKGAVVSWTSLAPRAGLAVPFSTRLGTTRLFAGYSRYYHLLPAAYADFANANGLGARVFRWRDANRDGLFQPGEEGSLLRVFGGPYSSIDPALKRPLTDEYGFGLEQGIGSKSDVILRLFRRDSRRLIRAVNVGVPESAFTPVAVLDPGNDGVVGTGDDQSLTVYRQDPPTLGQDRFLLTNPERSKAVSKGLEAALRVTLAEKGFVAVSFAAYKARGPGNPGNAEFENDTGVVGALYSDPNTLLNSIGRLYFDRAYVGKVAGYYEGPFGLRFGTVISYFDGLPFGRRLPVTDFPQGPFFVMATPRGQPGGFRTQFNLIFDQRVACDVSVARVRMSVMVDIFNLLNLNKNLRESDLTGPAFSLRRPLQVQNPRVLRIGLRWSF